jgi:hypothetical protein
MHRLGTVISGVKLTAQTCLALKKRRGLGNSNRLHRRLMSLIVKERRLKMPLAEIQSRSRKLSLPPQLLVLARFRQIFSLTHQRLHHLPFQMIRMKRRTIYL